MQTKDNIGLFDSGIGGTSIWKEVVTQLPHENTIYLADSKFAPYGARSKEDIIKLSVKNTEKLISLGSKIIVVACNTATTNAIDYLREHYDIPFIGIEPAIKPAALNSKSKTIGILATKGTLNSTLFQHTSEKWTQGTKVIEVIGEGLVPLIEKGDLHSPILKKLLESYIAPMIAQHIDYLVLGCSHYPYLIPLLNELLPPQVTIIDSGLAVARQTKSVLMARDDYNSTSNASHKLFTNGDPSILEKVLVRFRESVTPPLNITIDRLDF